MENLKKLTGKKNILLVSRGNKAIFLALQTAKKKGCKKLYVPDQGGWYTYAQYGKKLGFEIIEIKTERGIIDFDPIKNGCVIFNDMPAYAFLQNTERNKNVFYIGDVTGSIGTRKCKADIVVCSFGNHKVIELGQGGMIATNIEMNYESDFKGDAKELEEKVKEIDKRLEKLKKLKTQVSKDLKEFDILQGDGLNILVKGDEEKIIKYCEDNQLEYKKCPMKIKIKEDAISIELTSSVN
ncbi:hypothetical protein HN592_01360 [Candidatus Woesearchaeota archaeon]|jgi:hypothetical protein|nr:hypothetical protein [Candidatus Woesearchaeota archaeon]MBT4368659.1 hypothetical protein [Candidatus Woesearchaeota archaeon]MBT4712214.1 hypothetical protein [Candidatus Woesearchaeota archaeon]MBT6638954.1 hypothetical protein [Candidatus Woesearchaeota archaeon]MBT7134144.1 hypothetical protein [Candidatus Woesearchaeota archaeon]